MLTGSVGGGEERAVIITADDLGISEGVNRGIFESFDAGVVTSASLMVWGPAAAAAAAGAAGRPRLAVGLHVDLAEWSHRDGSWERSYERADLDDPLAVAIEVERQLEAFCSMLGRPPTHLDSHQHVHRQPTPGRCLAALGRRLGVPVRDHGIPYRGDFYGQLATGEPFPDGITVANLLRLIESLPIGVTEIGCHPGYPDGLASGYAAERLVELRALCAPEVLDAIARTNTRLVSFAELGAKPAR